MRRGITRDCRPPTLATSMVSSSSTIADSAQPDFRFSFSASQSYPADGDVAGEVIATDANHSGVPQAAALVDRDVGRAAPDVHERDAELHLVLAQDRGRGRELSRRRRRRPPRPSGWRTLIRFWAEVSEPVMMWTLTSRRIPSCRSGP